MKEKKLMVTGCNGQLGRALKKITDGIDGFEYIGTDVEDLDITDLDAVRRYTADMKPSVIVNCAAMTNVDGCEKAEETAFKINAIGPRNLAIAAEESGAEIVHISTDYVFPGDQERPRNEFDAVGPISAYGRSKLAGEEFVRAFSRRRYIIRTAWLYGDGKNFVRTMLKISEDHDSVGVVDDQIGNPTSASELAMAVKKLALSGAYGTYHGTCEGICSWADFTEEIFRLAGRNTRVEHISSEEYKKRFPASADRPKFSALDNMMFRLATDIRFADWRDAIAEYIREGA